MKTLGEALRHCEERAAGNRVEATEWRYLATLLRELQTLQTQWPLREREIETRARAECAAMCRAYHKNLEPCLEEIDVYTAPETSEVSLGRYCAAVDLEAAILPRT